MPLEELDFSRRAEGQELMDLPCSYEDFHACLRDLNQINLLTLGFRPTLQWLNRLTSQFKQSTRRPLHIVDVGCGGGDMLRRVQRWAGRRQLEVKLTGIDLNPYAALAAKKLGSENDSIEWITGDAFSYPLSEEIDVVISSLFTHHLAEEDLRRFLIWMEQRSTHGWFINDLHRQPGPYRLFRLMAKVARWHRFVQHDGPLSIRRSFDWQDWRRHCAAANIQDARIEAFRPARLCVGRIKQGIA